jgi:DNA-nicking Smr family endonuclease
MRRTTKEERELFLAVLAAPHKLATKAAPKRRTRKRLAQVEALADDEPQDAPGKRRTTREERALFEDALSGHAPARKSTPKSKPSSPTATSKAQKTPTGLDGNTARRLKKGEIAPTAKLDLHGLTEASAHRALTAFVLSAHRRGDRLILIVTGKGGASPDPERRRGVLRMMVPRWLDEAPMAKHIAEKRWAHIRHGGEGALYVYLRKAKA